MAGEKKISLKAVLLTAVLTAALAFKTAAEAATASLASVQTDDDATKKAWADALAQLATANAALADAQQHLADFQDEETLDQHPELVAQMTALGVTDAQVVAPPASVPVGTPPAGNGSAPSDAGPAMPPSGTP
jgi:hypothetical protein